MNSLEGFIRNVAGVEKPKNIEDLTQLVAKANSEKLKLYPISIGKNWGYGTQLPVEDNCIVVDLSSMNQILELNLDQGYAVIEPGVTQRQLYEELIGSNYYFDVTGSSSESSILGNIVERGVGYHHQRCELVNAFEVLLGNGELIRTGFWNREISQISHLYRHGLGPGMQDLFYQSNFGIVTKASIRLLNRPESELSFTFQFNNDQLEDAVETIAGLKRDGIIHGIAHLASIERFRSTAAPLLYSKLKTENKLDQFDKILISEIQSDWYLVGKIQGTKELVDLSREIVKKRLKSFSPIYFLTEDEAFINSFWARLFLSESKKHILMATKSLRGLNFGIPTKDAVIGAVWDRMEPEAVNEKLEDNKMGWIFYTPLAPLSGESAKLFRDITESTAKEFNLPVAITLNFLSNQILEAVISLQFDKATNSSAAHNCIEQISSKFREIGFLPYRINIEQMDKFVDQQNSFWRTAGKIKDALDPNNIIAPGRYSIK